jgi:hypothetical protein
MSHPDELRRRFAAMDHAALVELAVELVTTYVVEGLGTLSVATQQASPAKGADQLGEETFAGMLRRLKGQRPGDPVLDRFIVNGEYIQVRTPMGNVDVTEYRRPNAPTGPAVTAPPPSVPTAESSIYNRELRGLPPANAARGAQQRPQGGASAPASSSPPPAAAPANNASRPANPPATSPAPASPAQGGQQNTPKPAGDRGRMIELD